MKEEEIKFIILPNNRTGKVKAEIYIMVDNPFILQGESDNIKRVLLKKEFGSNWPWVLPTNRDYTKAREWVWDQIEYIMVANKPLTPKGICFRTTYKEEIIPNPKDGGTSMKSLCDETLETVRGK